LDGPIVTLSIHSSSKNNSSSILSNSNESSRAGSPNTTTTKIAKDPQYFTELKDSSQPNRKLNRSESDENYDPRFAQRSSFVWRFLNSCLHQRRCGGSCLDYISLEVLVILPIAVYCLKSRLRDGGVSYSIAHAVTIPLGQAARDKGAMVLPSNILVSLLVKDVGPGAQAPLRVHLSHCC